MPDFLLEIGCEEIPARMIDAASLELRERVQKLLEREHLSPVGTISSVDSPRRLAVLVAGIPAAQPDVTEQVNGPSTNAAFKDGKPTAAADSFARKAGVDVSQLKRVTTSKGEYLTAEIRKRGRSAVEVLSQSLPKEINSSLLAEEYVLAQAEREVRAAYPLAGGLAGGGSAPARIRWRSCGKRIAWASHSSSGRGTHSEVRARHMLRLYVPPKYSVAPSESSVFEKNSMLRLAQFLARVGVRIKLFWTPL